MTASGSAAAQPAGQVGVGLPLAGPVLRPGSVSRLDAVEGLGACVVRAGADRAHGWPDAGFVAGVGEGPAGVRGSVVGVQGRSGEAAADAFRDGQSIDAVTNRPLLLVPPLQVSMVITGEAEQETGRLHSAMSRACVRLAVEEGH